MKLGSLCTGYGGLDMAVQEVFGGEVAWFAEIDPRAAALFSHHHPGVPNLGDLRQVAWSDVEPVDILTAGFPCQPVSQAGRRKGVTDERWLFDDIADAVRQLRPRLVVCENVLGLLTANGGAAMGHVTETLAALGYVGRWGVVAASDVGAPHRRKRVFIVAADAGCLEPERWGGPAAVVGAQGDARVEGRGSDEGRDALGDRDCTPADADGLAWSSARQRHGGPDAPGVEASRGLARQAIDGADGRARALADADGDGREGFEARDGAHGCVGVEHGHDADGRGAADRFGVYGPAVERWESVLGRPAPDATTDGRRLNPAFVEFMMGLPEGWVTGVESTRTHALRILGNGVVPQQAAHALRLLVGAA